MLSFGGTWRGIGLRVSYSVETCMKNCSRRATECEMNKACDMACWPCKGPLGAERQQVQHHRGRVEAVGKPWRLLGGLCKAQLQLGLGSFEERR